MSKDLRLDNLNKNKENKFVNIFYKKLEKFFIKQSKYSKKEFLLKQIFINWKIWKYFCKKKIGEKFSIRIFSKASRPYGIKKHLYILFNI